MIAVKEFWERSRIPTQKDQRAKDKVLRMYERWRALNKSSKQRTQSQVRNEEEFLLSLDHLFDTAHEQAMSMITMEEDRKFLMGQRAEVRRGRISSVRDMVLHSQEREKKGKEKKLPGK